MNKPNDFFNNCNPILQIIFAAVILLILGGICILLEPILVALSYVFLGIGILLALIWIIKGITNIFK